MSIYSWVANKYLDVHCTTYTPTSFMEIFTEIVELGILNIEISPPEISGNEFFVKMTKLGEPTMQSPKKTKKWRLYFQQLTNKIK